MLNVGILVFDEVEVLDFAGPFEVFSTAARLEVRSGREAPFHVSIVAKVPGLVRARGGLRVEPDFAFEQHPMMDVLIVPGGDVSGQLQDDETLRWIARTAPLARVTASVCTGAFLLAAARLLQGRRATTHWEDAGELQRMYAETRVETGRRWIDEDAIVTSAGVSAGLDMSLHLVGRLAGSQLAAATARQMDYAWQGSAKI